MQAYCKLISYFVGITSVDLQLIYNIIMTQKRTIYVITLLFALIACTRTYATHIFGGELLYEYVSGNTYRVTLTIYGDCSGNAFPTLNNSSPRVYLEDDAFTLSTITLYQQGPGIEVSPVCPDEINNTKCKSMSKTLPGVMKYVYSNTVDIIVKSDKLKFTFTGEMGTGTSAGRSSAITNITGSGVSLMYLEAKLNNLDGPNSSPKYNSIPTPYFCINKPQLYNQAAADADNDSLYFSLTPALENGGTVQYKPGFTATEPLATLAGSFKYYAINGQMAFTPNASQTSIVVNRVDEYKNGKFVGSSMREMTFIVLDNCQNDPPNTTINDDIVGGKYAGDNIIYVCDTASKLTFSISAADANNDHVNVTTSNVPTGASLVVSNNNTPAPNLDFSWNISGVQNGIYTFYVDYKDDACPLSSKQTVAYTIVITSPFVFDYDVLSPTRCYNKAYVNMRISKGANPKNITLSLNANVVKQFTDSFSAVTSNTDSLAVGNYTIDITSPNLQCGATYNFTIVDSGTYPFPPDYDNMHLCMHDNLTSIPTLSKSNTPIHWYDASGKRYDTPPPYSTATERTYRFLVTQQVGVCESVSDSFKIYVHKNADVIINTKSDPVCLGDKILLNATGADVYVWSPSEKVTKELDGNYYTNKLMEPAIFSVVGTTLFGCTDSASINFANIQQCCTYSYPNAFTPNGDGMNDGFRVVVYGNTSEYQLSIFNRWGQRVFMTNDPKKSWDGTFGGKLCDVGVYYYRVKGVCLTGPEEEQAGEFTLIR